MAKRWTENEDAMLLEYADGVGADFIASHDLGRPNGAGSKRYDHLIKSGAAAFYAQGRANQWEYILRAGIRVKGSEAEYIASVERDEWQGKAQKWAEMAGLTEPANVEVH